jgi:exopolyphosphatase/pppGpp-phosphohydrolase
VAVVDLGSNSVRLVVAEVIPGMPPRVVAEEREPVRLGESVFYMG